MASDGTFGDKSAHAAARASGLASAALGLALFAYICFWGLGGFIAVVLGFGARAEIARSAGRIRGKRRATLAIALGVLNVALTAAAAVYAGRALARWMETTTRPAHAPPPRAPRKAAPGAGRPAPSSGDLAAFRGSIDPRTIVTAIGRIVVVDPGRDAHPLREFLDRQHAECARSHAKLLVMVTTPGCEPCAGVSAALSDPRMQRALAGVRLVRLDLAEFGQELLELGLPTEKIPGFVLVAPNNQPLDYIHGGEWDADTPRNIAPVLHDFVRGTLTVRRHPWHGGPHPNETPISYFW